jgi:peroxiredoxin
MIKSIKASPLIFIVLILLPLVCQGQIAKLTPERPKWGDTVRVTYDPAAEGAAFLTGDEVFAICHIRQEKGADQKWMKMEKTGGVFYCEIPISEGTGFLRVYFISKEDWDQGAMLSSMVYREDGLPARGANQEMMIQAAKEYLDYFQRERELYPDNYAVFREKWFLQGALDKKNLLPSLEKDMEILKNEVTEETDEWLFTVSYGLLLLDDEQGARNLLRKLVREHPKSFYTGYALGNYDYQAFSKQMKGEGPKEVKEMKKEILRANPLSSFSREQVLSFTGEEDVSLETVHLICDPWIQEEQDNPLPYYILAEAYAGKTNQLARCVQLLDKAIGFLLRGKFRLYGDVSGFRTQRYMPLFFQKRAEIHLRMEDWANALSDIKTAQALEKEAKPDYFETEGAIWRKLGLNRRAEETLLEASRLGSSEAAKTLRDIYRVRHGGFEGFESYFSGALKKKESAKSEEKPMAPDFDVHTLEGKQLNLSGLRGKVVVLNFWFTGCAPCRVEMPGLNNLTDDFKDKDVVFIAFALDGADALESFLKEKQFDYQIVPDASKIATLYGVEAYPTHIIINPEGQIEFTLTGGSPDRHDQLRPLIQNMLR